MPRQLAGAVAESADLPRRFQPVFLDHGELAASSDLGAHLKRALSESRNLIVLCSPHSAQSRWVNEEVLHFKRMGRAADIRCIIADGRGSSEWAPEACFCPALLFDVEEDGSLSDRPTSEPLAADLREARDGRRNGLLRLIAGMLGVGFDRLKQRERRRRHTRLAVVSAFSALLITAFSTAIWQWHEGRTA